MCHQCRKKMWKYLNKLTDNGEKFSVGAQLAIELPDARNVQSFVEAKQIIFAIFANTEVSTALKEKNWSESLAECSIRQSAEVQNWPV